MNINGEEKVIQAIFEVTFEGFMTNFSLVAACGLSGLGISFIAFRICYREGHNFHASETKIRMVTAVLATGVCDAFYGYVGSNWFFRNGTGCSLLFATELYCFYNSLR